MSSRVFLTSCLIAGALTACRKQPPADEHMSHMASGDLSQQPVASSTSQGDLSLPASSMHTAARLAASPRHSEWVKLAYPDGKGDSLTINDVNADTVTWNSPTNWHASTAALGTPGLAETAAPAQHAIVTNEVLANSPTGPNDWIELRNTTGAAIDVSGWYLSDSGSNLLKFRIPANTIIPAGGYVVFTEQQDFGNVLLGASAFSLSSTGDDVYLSSSATAGILGAYRDAAHFGASDPGVTMGRYQTSTGRTDFVALAKPTQGAANAPAAAGPVVINELMYHPQGSGDEYIEIKNVSTSAVPLYDPANPANTWHFTNGVDFAFPTGLSLAPGEIMIVIPSTISVADFRTKYGIPPASRSSAGTAARSPTAANTSSCPSPACPSRIIRSRTSWWTTWTTAPARPGPPRRTVTARRSNASTSTPTATTLPIGGRLRPSAARRAPSTAARR